MEYVLSPLSLKLVHLSSHACFFLPYRLSPFLKCNIKCHVMQIGLCLCVASYLFVLVHTCLPDWCLTNCVEACIKCNVESL